MMATRTPIDFRIGGKEVQITGRVLKTVRLRSEGFVGLEDPDTFVREVRESGVRADLLTFVQGIEERRPRYSFHSEVEEIAALPITTYDDWFGRQLHFRPRNKLRKALKSGVEIRLEELSEPLLRGIKAVYDETPIRQGRRNRHYRKDFETIRREHATFMHRSQFISAYHAGEMIGFAKVTFSEGCGIFMNFLSKVRHRDKAPNNAILAKAVEICADRKLKWLVYGVWGSGGNPGLVEFKVANGFECVEVPRYFVPLTGLGRLALTVGVHRGIATRLPGWCIEVAAKVRKQWNTLTVGTWPGH